jgi:hypothetical protein
MDLSLLGWLRREFASVARGLLTLQPDLIPLAAPPERPTEGMLRYANGTDWDPGSGKGVYVFDGTTWVKL